MLRFALTSGAAVAAALMATAPAQAAKDDLLLVSSPPVAPFALNESSGSPNASRDGRFVAFVSQASNLVPGDTNGETDVFVKDLASGEVERVSRASGGAQADDGSYAPSISADGRYVAFDSRADNLVPGVSSAGNQSHVFVRDRVTGTTVAADRTGAGAIGTGSAEGASISADGRNVAFVSDSPNLAAGADDPAVVDAYAKNLDTGAIVLLSRGSGANGAPSNGLVSRVRLSADGKYAAFTTNASNLGTANNRYKVYRRSTAPAGALTLISRAAGANGAAADDDAGAPSLSADGDVVAFQSKAKNLHGADVDAATDVFARSVSSTTVSLVSRADGVNGAGGNGASGSYSPSVSDDGDRVAFLSYSDNLSDADDDSYSNVYVRDRAAHTTTYVSRASGPNGAAAGQGSDQPAISGDARWVAFRSEAANLSAADADGYADVFARDVLGGPGGAPQAAGGGSAPGGAAVPAGRAAARAVRFRVLGLRASRARFRARRGTKVTLRVSKPARVRLTLRRKAGRRYVTVGRVRRTTGGTLTLTVKRRFAGKRLRVGRYRLSAELRDTATGRLIRSGNLALRVTR